MGIRLRVVALCAALAAAVGFWPAWRHAPSVPTVRRTAEVAGGPGETRAVPPGAPPHGGPSAADEGDITARSVGRVRTEAAQPLPRAVPARPRAPTGLALRQPSARIPRVAAPHTATTVRQPPPHAAPVPPSSASATPNLKGKKPVQRAPAASSSDTPAAGASAGGSTGASTTTAGPPQSGAAAGAGAMPGAGGAAEPDYAMPAPPLPPTRTPVLLPPKVIATPGSLYPGDAFRLTVRRQDLGAAAVIEGTEGTVTIRAFVRSTGDVQSVDVMGSSGSDVLDRAAAETVRGWRFAPATRDGAPIDAYVTLRLRYVVR